MRQLITRLDDDLHALVKERARGAGTSVNAYVVGVLREAVSREEGKSRLRERLQRAGQLVVPAAGGPPPGRDAVIEQLQGAADVVIEAIEAGRTPR